MKQPQVHAAPPTFLFVFFLLTVQVHSPSLPGFGNLVALLGTGQGRSSIALLRER